MRTQPARFLLSLALTVAATAASAAGTLPAPLLKYKGGIGADPLTAAGGVDTLNVVRGINPGGRAWVIAKLEGAVYSDASVVLRGKGLLISSGELIATRGPVTHVAATLACGAADATATKFSTAPSPLDAAGNFHLRGPLMDGANIAVLPASCDNPQLLIRSANPTTGAAGAWFAVGVRDLDD